MSDCRCESTGLTIPYTLALLTLCASIAVAQVLPPGTPRAPGTPGVPGSTTTPAAPAAPLGPPRLTQVLPKTTLTTEDTTAIDTFVNGWTRILCESTVPTEIAEARRQLIEPLRNPVTSNPVREAYIRSLSAAITGCANAEQSISRLNALIVSAELPNATVYALAAPGLVDPDPAIRYWSAKAVADVAGKAPQGTFDDAQQKQLLASLTKGMGSESSDMILEQMARAIASLSIPEAQNQLLTVLGDRVALFLHQPNTALRVDVKLLSEMQRKLVNADAAGTNIEPQLRQLVTVVAKFAHAVAKMMTEGRVGPDVQPYAVEMMKLADEVFAYARNELDSSVNLGPPLAPLAEANKPTELMLNVLAWVGTADVPGALNQGRIAFTPADLALPAPRAPQPPPAPKPEPQPATQTATPAPAPATPAPATPAPAPAPTPAPAQPTPSPATP